MWPWPSELHTPIYIYVVSSSQTMKINTNCILRPAHCLQYYYSFRALMAKTHNAPTTDQLRAFLSDNFKPTGELEIVTPKDWKANPAFLQKIVNPSYQKWAADLNVIWKNLTRRVKDEVKINPDRHSLIYVANPFVIPGGRFKGEWYRGSISYIIYYSIFYFHWNKTFFLR